MTDEATPATPHHKRLAGLWLICFLLGMGGMAFVQGALLGTPLGMVCFGATGVVCFGAAVGLWVRSNAARVVVMALLGFCSAASLVGFSLHPLEGATWCVVPLGIALLMIVALRLRRRYFLVPPEQKPRLRTVSAYVTAGGVLLLSVPVILILMIDDAPREFPLMELADLSVPDEENGFLVLEQMVADMPPWPDEETELFFELTDSDDAEDAAEWYVRGADVVADWEPWLARIDEVLARPGFDPPAYGNVVEWNEGSTEWLAPARGIARRLAMASDVYLHEGRFSDAMATAVKVVELGARVSESNNSHLTHLVGMAIAHMGAEQVTEVLGAEGATVDLLRPQIDRLAVGERFRRGAVRSYAHEFHTFVDAIPAIKQPGVLSALVRDALPVLKLNMTRNVQGELMSEFMGLLAEYDPHEPEYRTGPCGIEYFTEEMDGWHLVRNPLGDILVGMMLPALRASAQVYHLMAARLDMTRLAMAIRCHHLAHGELPATLDELAPEYLDGVPVDPFTQMPFDYRPGAETPVLYSVGPDLAPDAGTEDGDDLIIELTFAARGDEQ